MNDRRTLRHPLAPLALVLGLICGAATSGMAQKIAKTMPDPAEGWHPKDGVYATPGPDFNDRCSHFEGLVLGPKVDGLVLELSNGSVSIGENECSILTRSSWRSEKIYLTMMCKGKTDVEIMNLQKIDDRTIMIRGRHELMGASSPVAYCGEEAQRADLERQGRMQSRWTDEHGTDSRFADLQSGGSEKTDFVREEERRPREAPQRIPGR